MPQRQYQGRFDFKNFQLVHKFAFLQKVNSFEISRGCLLLTKKVGNLKFEIPGGSRVGFTLIELLVAISILAIISSIGLVTYTNAQKFGRDSRRKNDLRSLQVALDLYYATWHHYPTFAQTPCAFPPGQPDIKHNLACAIRNGWENTIDPPACPNSWLSENIDGIGCTRGLSPHYMNTLPIDPINSSFNSFYGYKTNSYAGDDPNYPSTIGKPCPGDGQWYALLAVLENDKDADTLGSLQAAGKPFIWCDGVTQVLPNQPPYYMPANYFIIMVKH